MDLLYYIFSVENDDCNLKSRKIRMIKKQVSCFCKNNKYGNYTLMVLHQEKVLEQVLSSFLPLSRLLHYLINYNFRQLTTLLSMKHSFWG